MDIFKRDRSAPGFRLTSHLQLLQEIQMNARASRSARLFAGLVQNVQRSFASLTRQIGARRVVKVQLTTPKIRIKKRR